MAHAADGAATPGVSDSGSSDDSGRGSHPATRGSTAARVRDRGKAAVAFVLHDTTAAHHAKGASGGRQRPARFRKRGDSAGGAESMGDASAVLPLSPPLSATSPALVPSTTVIATPPLTAAAAGGASAGVAGSGSRSRRQSKSHEQLRTPKERLADGGATIPPLMLAGGAALAVGTVAWYVPSTHVFTSWPQWYVPPCTPRSCLGGVPVGHRDAHVSRVPRRCRCATP
jgi:hypothetical protein